MSDLTEPLRAALERFGDEWTLLPRDGPKLREAFDAGLLESQAEIMEGHVRLWIRRTPAGRAALEVKP